MMKAGRCRAHGGGPALRPRRGRVVPAVTTVSALERVGRLVIPMVVNDTSGDAPVVRLPAPAIVER